MALQVSACAHPPGIPLLNKPWKRTRALKERTGILGPIKCKRPCGMNPPGRFLASKDLHSWLRSLP